MGIPKELAFVLPVDFTLLSIEPTISEAIASLVNAVRLATRKMMRNGAMTYQSPGQTIVSQGPWYVRGHEPESG